MTWGSISFLEELKIGRFSADFCLCAHSEFWVVFGSFSGTFVMKSRFGKYTPAQLAAKKKPPGFFWVVLGRFWVLGFGVFGFLGPRRFLGFWGFWVLGVFRGFWVFLAIWALIFDHFGVESPRKHLKTVSSKRHHDWWVSSVF